MVSITRDSVLAALSGIGADEGSGDIVARGLVSEIIVKDGNVTFAIAAEPGRAAEMEPVRRAAEAAIRRLPGVGRVMVALTADRPGAAKAGARASSATTRGTTLDGVGHIVAVASGKGGVGKSTTAVNLAIGLSNLGLKVGILDADIYGPSMPRLLGITQRPRLVAPDSKIMAPMEKYGLKVMSMGFLVDEATPVVWRGPMVMGALVQMLREVAWAPLDCLVVDMPPGTGDVQLTLAQQTPLAGAVIVSTPQDLALIDARKGLNMFARVNVPVLGIVENMSYFICSHCGTRHEIFDHGGARQEAETLGVPFLGEVPLDAHLRERSDKGEPITASEPQSASAAIYRDIARKLWDSLATSTAKPPPRIVVER
ncbi:MAG TPA: Mrp/NBP35 family ATP-binding protein [Aestuariivirgaceae bacterium]|nr:Mrp/NBP35 family ATP-binding protein [Aestuariivirgaceae bacterium]